MKKEIDLTKSVYDLCKEYPELIEVMKGLGFTEITRKTALTTAGRVMTIPKGAEIMSIPMERVLTVIKGCGFEVTGYNTQKDLLKSYIRRLNDGEALETVRKDFVKEFQDVEASVIMEAEQEMIASGIPITEVQKLCDVHSALFHGITREEQIENAEKAVSASLEKKKTREDAWKVDYSDKQEAANRLVSMEGHPLQIFTLENEKLAQLISQIREGLATGKDVSNQFDAIRAISIHYAKKGDLIYPLLKVQYGISGPSDVMWTVDDEIRDEMNALSREIHNESWQERLLAVLQRADEMIYKEANILFPICAKNFSENEWKQIYHELAGYDKCLIDTVPVWADAKAQNAPTFQASSGEIIMPSGHLTVEQLTAMLNTIPMEITFIDENNMNRYYNEGWKLFKRPLMSLDREVFSCHPPKIEVMVRAIIEDFRNHRRDSVPVWMEKMGKTMLVTYTAVRDKSGKYLGTVELIQEMEFAKKHFMK
ncbi:MAG TPA: DUF438 domain-containing protein [Lachnospiraceae bacterium]|nr:DUF438 domain-containing protein [Lachnospiraceae bacterium]